MNDSPLPVIALTRSEMFGAGVTDGDDPFMVIDEWSLPVRYFVGRNGSGKSRAAKALCSRLNGHLLSTDRLLALMSVLSYDYGPIPQESKGLPLDSQSERAAIDSARIHGGAARELYTLRNEPAVWIKVAAFIRRALGRTVELRDRSGYIDPVVRMGSTEYSLLRDEGHGLRELVVLLTATYGSTAPLLVIDEPELHMHPAMTRLWATELNREMQKSNRRAVVVTHEPSLIQPRRAQDLDSLWLFQPETNPINMGTAVLPQQRDRVTASLQLNPQLVGQVVFSPRPVLVEGEHDMAAFTTALARLCDAAVVAQTDLVNCWGNGNVAMWYEICGKLGLTSRAVADLDSLFVNDVQRILDSVPQVAESYEQDLGDYPGRTATALRTLIEAADRSDVAHNPKARAQWLAALDASQRGLVSRRDKILSIWKEAGFWLHPQGTLEDALGITAKGSPQAREAAASACGIDGSVVWAAYELDPTGEEQVLLRGEVERVANQIMRAQGQTPGETFDRLLGPTAASDERLMRLEPLEDGRYRLVIVSPEAYAGYTVEFSRSTSNEELTLQAPPDGEG